jgi:DeoR/GlpR family transcriptional regulator of sugar metabolism
MLHAERRQYILERLQREGKVVASELSVSLDVSEDTIRRDLRDLAEQGLLTRVHGGALPRSPAAVDYQTRQRNLTPGKVAIARQAANLVRKGQVVLMCGGTTNVQIAQHFAPDLSATVITHNPLVAINLAQHPLIEVVLLGGRFFKQSLVTVGSVPVEALRTIRADICMLGVCSLHPEVGISIPDLEESYVQRAMIASAAEVVALASAEKLGTASSYVVGPLSELTHIITEKSVAADQLQAYRALGITIIQG